MNRDRHIAKCKYCGAEIVWTVTPDGKRMPCDAKPVVEGGWIITLRTNNVAQRRNEPTLYSEPHLPTVPEHQGRNRYESHFARCAKGVGGGR